MMKKFIKQLDDHIEGYLCVIVLAAMSVIIFAQVVGRYVFNNSLSWSEESARYLFVWLVYLAISYGVKVDGHIRVDAFLMPLPKKAQKVVRIVSNLLFLAFGVLVLYFGIVVTGKILDSHQNSPAIGMPMWFLYLAVPFGFTLTIIRLVQNTLKRLKTVDGTVDGAVDGASTGSV
jgi:TRAP-type C4-dicarboxylate transport system permease small subunit